MQKEFYEKLKNEEEKLKGQKKLLERRLKNAPEGSLRVMMARGKYPQYYCYDSSKKDKHPHGTYIRKKNLNLARRLAQKEYDREVLRKIGLELKLIQRLAVLYQEPVEDLYRKLSLPRRSLVEPLEPDDETFLSKWREGKVIQGNTYPIESNIFTENGEHVRSKSEKIIADKFLSEGIPYIYEPMLKFSDGYGLFPDFVLMNMRTRKEYYYEHFGMMDDPEYSAKAIRKMQEYQKRGFFFGENLLYTFEMQKETIDTRELQKLIKRYLK